MTQPARRRRLSNVARFWIGVALCVPVLFLVGLLVSLPSMVGNELNLPGELSGIATFGMSIGLLATGIVGLVRESTRFIVVGILAGLAILLVLAAGACIVLLAGLGNPNS